MRNFNSVSQLLAYGITHYGIDWLIALLLFILGAIAWRRSKAIAFLPLGFGAIIVLVTVVLLWVEAQCCTNS